MWRKDMAKKIKMPNGQEYYVCDNCDCIIFNGKSRRVDKRYIPYWFWSHPVCKYCFWSSGGKLAKKWGYECNQGRWNEGEVTSWVDIKANQDGHI